MAKHKLTEGGFTLLPEGVTIFKVTKVDYDEDFGKLTATLQTKSGSTQLETFSLINADGEVNEGANRAFSYFAKTCLNNYKLEEVDDNDLIGCYIKADVKHEEYVATRGKNAGKTMKTCRLSNYEVAFGFEGALETKEETSADNIDDFLND